MTRLRRVLPSSWMLRGADGGPNRNTGIDVTAPPPVSGEQADAVRTARDCRIAGLDDLAGGEHDRTLTYQANVLRGGPVILSADMTVRHDPTPSDAWDLLLLVGGPHHGQTHTMPSQCESWSCGTCGAEYA